jgi:predicted secreted protein
MQNTADLMKALAVKKNSRRCGHHRVPDIAENGAVVPVVRPPRCQASSACCCWLKELTMLSAAA